MLRTGRRTTTSPWMMVQCRHCSYSCLKLSLHCAYYQHCFHTVMPLRLPLHQHWKKSDHPEMCSVSSSEFAVALSSMSHSLTVTALMMPWPMSESVTGTIWRLRREGGVWVWTEAPGWVERRGVVCNHMMHPICIKRALNMEQWNMHRIGGTQLLLILITIFI